MPDIEVINGEFKEKNIKKGKSKEIEVDYTDDKETDDKKKFDIIGFLFNKTNLIFIAVILILIFFLYRCKTNE